MKKSFEIADLIVAFINGTISPEDLAILDSWLEESEENKRLFVSFMDEVVFENEKNRYTPEKLNSVFSKIKNRKQQLHKKRNLRIWTAAAASIAIVFSVMFLYNRQPSVPVIAENSTISVGKSLAYLQLSSGEKIVLQENQKDTITTGTQNRKIILDNGKVEISGQNCDTVKKEEFYLMEVPRGAEYKLTLPDGTRVWLNADSKLKFPAYFSFSQRYVELSGEAYFEVTHDEARPFVVHSEGIDVKVLGTEFCLRNYANRPILTTLVKGSVEVTDPTCRKTILKPGQQSVTNNGNTTVQKVETIYYTAWKDGYFIFENTPLEDIMEELSLWYNCHYFFANSDAAKLRITARLKKYDEIDVLLGILSKTNEIQMEKKNNTIVIQKK